VGLEGEPISPELVLVSPELRRLALQQLVEAAEQEERGLQPLHAAEPLRSLPDALPPDDAGSALVTSRGRGRGLVLAAIFSRARKTGKVIAFCAVEVVIVVAAVLLVKVIAG
jgi:hypothetical protein